MDDREMGSEGVV